MIFNAQRHQESVDKASLELSIGTELSTVVGLTDEELEDASFMALKRDGQVVATLLDLTLGYGRTMWLVRKMTLVSGLKVMHKHKFCDDPEEVNALANVDGAVRLGSFLVEVTFGRYKVDCTFVCFWAIVNGRLCHVRIMNPQNMAGSVSLSSRHVRERFQFADVQSFADWFKFGRQPAEVEEIAD